MINYIAEKTNEVIPLTRQNVEGKIIQYTSGLSAADPLVSGRPRDRTGL